VTEPDPLDRQATEQEYDDLVALNRNLKRLGVDPLVDDHAGLVLAGSNVEALHVAVIATGDYLAGVARKLREVV